MVGLDFRFRGNDGWWGWISGNDGWWGWISACAGNDGVFFSGVGVWVDEFPRARELWIPAFAGMTDGGGVDSAFVGMTDGGVGFPLSWE